MDLCQAMTAPQMVLSTISSLKESNQVSNLYFEILSTRHLDDNNHVFLTVNDKVIPIYACKANNM